MTRPSEAGACWDEIKRYEYSRVDWIIAAEGMKKRKRMIYADKFVSHGLRILECNILNEEGKDPDLIEAALAHVDANQVRSSYNRAEYLGHWRELMGWWSSRMDTVI